MVGHDKVKVCTCKGSKASKQASTQGRQTSSGQARFALHWENGVRWFVMDKSCEAD